MGFVPEDASNKDRKEMVVLWAQRQSPPTAHPLSTWAITFNTAHQMVTRWNYLY